MIELTRTSTFTLHTDEEGGGAIYRAIRDTLRQFDTSDPRYVELVNKGHIDTLCVLRNIFGEEFK